MSMTFTQKSLWGLLLAGTVLSTPALALAQAGEPARDDQPTSVDEIIVRGRFIPDERRVTSEIANVVTAEDLQRTGDSEISTALSRVTGLSLVGSGYVYVRGLGERYSSALLDGAGLPSPEPLRRVVPLDIFPSAMLSGVLVQKTYSVEYPAEFGGGVVALRSRAVPEERFFEFGVGTGYNTASTGEAALNWYSGEHTWLGFSDGSMRLPGEIRIDPSLQSLDARGLQDAGRSLRPEWSLVNDKAPWDGSFSISGGTPFEFLGRRGGVLLSLDYDSEVRNRNGLLRTYMVAGGGLEASDDLSPEGCAVDARVDADACGRFRTDWNIGLNFIGALGLEVADGHSLRFTNMVLRNTTHQSEVQRGQFAIDAGSVRSLQRLNYVEQQLVLNQLSGEHRFNLGGAFSELDAAWRAVYSRADRSTPYVRETFYDFEPDGVWRLRPTPVGNSTSFSALEDDNLELGADFTLRGFVGDRAVRIQAGAVHTSRDRDFALRRYGFSMPAGVNPDLRAMVPEIIFAPDNIGPPGGLILRDRTDHADAYSAAVEINAAYLSSEVQLSPAVRWTIGARYEESSQSVDSFQAFTLIPVPIHVDLDFDKVLPATTLTWEFADNWQARVGYSQTLSRPDLRELSPTRFRDEESGLLERGNPDLQVTEIENFDARVEYYFGQRQSFTLGVFYKDFTSPIERTFSREGDEFLRSFFNADSAEILGVEAEVEWTLPFDRWASGSPFVQDRRFYVIANATWVDSEITLNPDAARDRQTDAQRPLQGQSEWVGNLQLGYERHDGRERLALLANYAGERIRDVGLSGAPNQMETPPVLLDLVYARTFDVGARELQFSFNARNLLGEKHEVSQGGFVAEEYELGTTISAGLSVRF